MDSRRMVSVVATSLIGLLGATNAMALESGFYALAPSSARPKSTSTPPLSTRSDARPRVGRRGNHRYRRSDTGFGVFVDGSSAVGSRSKLNIRISAEPLSSRPDDNQLLPDGPARLDDLGGNRDRFVRNFVVGRRDRADRPAVCSRRAPRGGPQRSRVQHRWDWNARE